MLCIDEERFEESLNIHIKEDWKPKFESYNVVEAYGVIRHYILLVKG